MTTIESLLAPIRKRAKAYAEHGTPGLAAPRDRAALLAAVEAVLELHKQEPDTDGEVWCYHCARLLPCPTVATVEGALGGDK